MKVLDFLTPSQIDDLQTTLYNLREASRDLASFSGVVLTNALVSAPLMAAELKRLNDNLESGRANIRQHIPNCVEPPKGDFTIRQLEVMSSYLFKSIETGALVLPPREADDV